MVFALFLVFVSILDIFVFFNRSPITLEYAEELLLLADTRRFKLSFFLDIFIFVFVFVYINFFY